MASLIPSFIAEETSAELNPTGKQIADSMDNADPSTKGVGAADLVSPLQARAGSKDDGVPASRASHESPHIQRSSGESQKNTESSQSPHAAPLRASQQEHAAPGSEAVPSPLTAQDRPEPHSSAAEQSDTSAEPLPQQLPDTPAVNLLSNHPSSEDGVSNEDEPDRTPNQGLIPPDAAKHATETSEAQHGQQVLVAGVASVPANEAQQAAACHQTAPPDDRMGDVHTNALVGDAEKYTFVGDVPLGSQMGDVASQQQQHRQAEMSIGSDHDGMMGLPQQEATCSTSPAPHGPSGADMAVGLIQGGLVHLVAGQPLQAGVSDGQRQLQQHQVAQQGGQQDNMTQQGGRQAQQGGRVRGSQVGGGELAAVSRSNVELVLTNRKDMARLVEVDQWIQGYCRSRGLAAPPSVLSGVVVRFHACKAYHLSSVAGMQLAPDGRVQLHVPEGVPSVIPLIGVSKRSVVATDALWAQHGQQEVEALRASMQVQGRWWTVEQVAAAGWRRKLALAWLDFVEAVEGDPQEEIASLAVSLSQGKGRGLARVRERVQREGGQPAQQAQQRVEAVQQYSISLSPRAETLLPGHPVGAGASVAEVAQAQHAQHAQRTAVPAEGALTNGLNSQAGTPVAQRMLGLAGSGGNPPSAQSASLLQGVPPGFAAPALQQHLMETPAAQQAQQAQPQAVRPQRTQQAQQVQHTQQRAQQQRPGTAAAAATVEARQQARGQRARRPIQWLPQEPQPGDVPLLAQQAKQAVDPKEGPSPTKGTLYVPLDVPLDVLIKRTKVEGASSEGDTRMEDSGEGPVPIQWKPQSRQTGDVPLHALVKRAKEGGVAAEGKGDTRKEVPERGPAPIQWKPQQPQAGDAPLLASAKADAKGAKDTQAPKQAPVVKKQQGLASPKPVAPFTRTITLNAEEEKEGKGGAEREGPPGSGRGEEVALVVRRDAAGFAGDGSTHGGTGRKVQQGGGSGGADIGDGSGEGEKLTIVMRADSRGVQGGGDAKMHSMGSAAQQVHAQQAALLQQLLQVAPGFAAQGLALQAPASLGGRPELNDLLNLPVQVLLTQYPPAQLQQLLGDYQRQLALTSGAHTGALDYTAQAPPPQVPGQRMGDHLPPHVQSPSPEEGEWVVEGGRGAGGGGDGEVRVQVQRSVEAEAESPREGSGADGRQVQLDPGNPAAAAEVYVHLPNCKGDLEGARRHLEALTRDVIPSKAQHSAVKRAALKGLLQRGLRESKSRGGRFLQQGVVVAQLGESLLQACRYSPQVASQYEQYGKARRVMLLARELEAAGVVRVCETKKGRVEVVLQVQLLKQLAGEAQGRGGSSKRPAEAAEQLHPVPSPKVRRLVVPDPSPPRPSHAQQAQQAQGTQPQRTPSDRKSPEYADFWDPIWRFEHQLVMHLRRVQQAPLSQLQAQFKLPPPHTPSYKPKYFETWIRNRPSRYHISEDGMVGAYMRKLLDYLAVNGERGCRVRLEDVARNVPLPHDLPADLVHQAQSNIWTFLVSHFRDTVWLTAPKHYTPDRHGLKTAELRPYFVDHPHSRAPKLKGVCSFFAANRPGSCNKQEQCDFSHCLERQLV